MVLLEVEELKNIWVPWFEVNCDGTLALAAALVDVAGSIVEYTKHWYNSVGSSVGPLDVGPLGTYVVNGQANSTG